MRRRPGGDPVVRAGATIQVVHVVDVLGVGRDDLPKRLGVTAVVPKQRLVLGGPVDVVGAGASDRPDVGRGALLEDHHVSVLTAVGRGLVDDRGGREAGLRPGHDVVVDHDCQGQAMSKIRGGEHSV